MTAQHPPAGTPDETALTAEERRELRAVLAGRRATRIGKARRLSRLSRIFAALGILVLLGLFVAWVFGAIEASSTTFAALATAGGLSIVIAILLSALGFAVMRPYLEDGRPAGADPLGREAEAVPGEDDLDDPFD